MTGWAIEALLASSLLMAGVLALRVPVRRLFGAQVGYALWALPALRLLLPPLPEGWRGEALPVLPAAEPIVIMLGRPVATLPVVAADGGIGWPPVALALWIAGAGAFLLWQAAVYLRFRYRVLRHGIVVDHVGSIAVVQSSATNGPLAFGVLDRVVAFPRDFAARFDAEERALALEHELGHHARGDLIANWAALAVLALHWFNPLAWAAFRAFRADQELANDARVLARVGRDARHAYGCAIVKAAHGRALSPACHLNTVRDLKGRLRMLGRGRASRTRMMAGGAAIAALAVGGLAFTASGTAAAERVRERVEDAAGVAMPHRDRTHVTTERRDGRPARTRVVVTKDGRTTTYVGQAAETYLAAHPVPPAAPVPPVPPVPPVAPVPPVPPIPPVPATPPIPVAARDCGADGSGVFVVDAGGEGRRATVTCVARGQRSAAESEAIRRRSLHGALAGLQSARAGLLANRALSDDHRRAALAGLDTALADVRDKVADLD